ncbi:MAG: hypothetical protein HYY44_07680 [Deltaproteobacteria bacterium]|nr:hypothetical protein [Deltaproteobacteria bacterium]
MFWLIRKLIFVGFLVGAGWFILQMDYHGRSVKGRIREFLNAPLIQEIVRQARGEVDRYLNKKKFPTGPAMENLDESERKNLNEVLKKESR